MQPTDTPLFTHLLAESWAQRAKTPKPTALGTMLRYSGAYGCGRRMGYDWFEAEPTEPPTGAAVWQAGMGTLVHEEVQAAIAAKHPDAVFELGTKVNEWISGSCDAFVPDFPFFGNVLYELKTMGEFAFDQQVGYKRRFGKLELTDPKGPKGGAITQAGMNALGVEDFLDVRIDNIVLGSLTFSVVSEKMVRATNISDFARFGAEFIIPREVWLPMATKEIDRLTDFAWAIDKGFIPERWAKDDDGNDLRLDPFGDNWQCSYCPYRTLCVGDGDGQIAVLDSKLTRRVKETQ